MKYKGNRRRESDERPAMPPAKPLTIIDEAATFAVCMPGFGNPLLLTVDVFDAAMSAWVDAQPDMSGERPSGSSRDFVERKMKELAR